MSFVIISHETLYFSRTEFGAIGNLLCCEMATFSFCSFCGIIIILVIFWDISAIIISQIRIFSPLCKFPVDINIITIARYLAYVGYSVVTRRDAMLVNGDKRVGIVFVTIIINKFQKLGYTYYQSA